MASQQLLSHFLSARWNVIGFFCRRIEVKLHVIGRKSPLIPLFQSGRIAIVII